MPITRRILTNFSKGELSPRIEGRPDLAAYFEGGKTVENFVIMRQGGLERRFGTRFVAEVKDSSKDTIILPFEASVNDAFIIEIGDLYTRFYKNKAQLQVASIPVELVAPYSEAQLRSIHFTQSVDVLFMFHEAFRQRRISRISDTNWAINVITATPPPSFEKDTDISLGATLTLGATSGLNILATASAGVFLAGDVGRAIVVGVGRGNIITFTDASNVRIDIIDPFASVGPIASGQWLLKLSPQTTLDPNIKAPIGALVTLVSGVAAFRNEDVGKFITIYGGLIEITVRDSNTQVKGIIRSELKSATTADPAAAPAGAWTLEVESWSIANGFPRTGEFFQGRLVVASTPAQPTTWWLSASDDFNNFAVGISADRAIEYTVASRKLNRIEWLADRTDLFFGTSGAELRAQSGKANEAFGGDIIPLVTGFTTNGSAPIQSSVVANRILYIDRSRRKIFDILFDFNVDNYDSIEITTISEHITEGGIRLGPTAFARRPDPRLYFVREDGTLIVLTYFHQEKVIGFSRIVTDGTFAAVAVIPHPAGTSLHNDEVWVVVKRTINGSVKRYIEVLEDNHESLINRSWKSLQTDCAIVYRGAPITIVTGLSHLEGKTVQVVADGGFRGTKVVSSGQITLTETASEVEVGLPFTSKVVTMRPGIPGIMIEGLPRSWDKIFVRLLNTVGGHVNDEEIQYSPSDLDSLGLFTGDRDVTGTGWDTLGRITIEQRLPYPMTLLAAFGTLTVSESD